jgi:hypothetical protein
MAMGSPVTTAVFLVASNFGKIWASRRMMSVSDDDDEDDVSVMSLLPLWG